MPEQEVGIPIEPVGLQRTQIKSPYFESALTIARKEVPGVEKEVSKLLENIDRQGIENISSYKSQVFEGVQIPYSKVDVNRLASESFDSLAGDYSDKREIHIIFCGLALPPAGHPFTAWDMVYDRAIGLLPKVVNPLSEGEKPPLVEVYSFGSPNGLGGKVTREWVEAIAKEGFAKYGEVYAELVKSLVPKDRENTRVIFEGMSMGSSTAQATATELGQEYRIQLLLDNPVGLDGGRVKNRFKVPVGFVREGRYFMREHPQRADLEGKSEKEFLTGMQSYLETNGLVDDKRQSFMKKLAVLVDVIKISGTNKFGEVRSFIRRATEDMTSFSEDFQKDASDKVNQGKNPVFAKGGALMFAIEGHHFIDRMRVKKWERVINFCKKIRPVSS